MAKLNAEQVFRAKAPAIMAQLIRDFPITPVDAAAILGDLGHESAGLTILQEIKGSWRLLLGVAGLAATLSGLVVSASQWWPWRG
ncbi:hypothetical protein [Devosia sp. A449]